jgi:2-polyprenyl-6-methoxyphenol hydroxylase-like FAD-dependent oxidoreductase
VWRARLPTQTDAKAIDIFFGPRSKAGILPTSADTMYLFLVVNHPERPDRTAGPRALGEALEDFGGPVAAAREAIGGPDDVYFGTLETTLMAPPWHRGRVVFVGDAVHATPPHIAYGAGLAIEDGVVLGESLAASQTLSSALERYAERRWERCRLVVHSGLQLGEWEQQPTPEADPAALTERTWRELAAPL